eukprot:1005708_1
MTSFSTDEHITIPLLIVAILLLIACKIWHFMQHFRLQSCWVPSSSIGRDRSRSTSILSSSSSIISALENKRNPCRCICIPDDEEFDFFPAAFFYYLTFQILLCLLIITLDIITYSNTYNKLH